MSHGHALPLVYKLLGRPRPPLPPRFRRPWPHPLIFLQFEIFTSAEGFRCMMFVRKIFLKIHLIGEIIRQIVYFYCRHNNYHCSAHNSQMQPQNRLKIWNICFLSRLNFIKFNSETMYSLFRVCGGGGVWGVYVCVTLLANYLENR